MKKFGFTVLIVLMLLFSVWMQTKAPCSWFQYSYGHRIPGRCLMP